jgi:O-acetylhomoserine (thiol)-lyase
MAWVFQGLLKELGNIYTRIMNPTQAAVEERLAALA